MKYKFVLAAVLFLLLNSGLLAQSSVLKPGDLKVLEGAEWIGELTYRDYSTNKLTAIKSNILISRLTSAEPAWIFDMRYPLEPKANKVSEIRLSSDGRMLAGENVVRRQKLRNGA